MYHYEIERKCDGMIVARGMCKIKQYVIEEVYSIIWDYTGDAVEANKVQFLDGGYGSENNKAFSVLKDYTVYYWED